MLIKRLKVENFLLLKKADIDFCQDFSTPIIFHGANGTGKSSIIDAITFALFRRARGLGAKATDIDKLIYHGASHFRVDLEFSVNDRSCKVICVKSRKHPTKFILSVDGSDLAVGGDIVEQVEKLIGFNYTIALSTILQVQGLSDFFLTRSANERFTILFNLFNSNVIQEVGKKAYDLRTEFNKQLTELQGKEKLWLKIIEEKKKYIEERGDKGQLGIEVKELEGRVSESHYRVVGELEPLQGQLVIVEEALKQLPIIRESKEELTKEWSSYNDIVRESDTELSLLKGERKYLNESLKEDTPCPICRRMIDKQTVEFIYKMKTNVDKRVEELSRNIETYIAKEEILTRKLKQLEERGGLEESRVTILSRVEELKKLVFTVSEEDLGLLKEKQQKLQFILSDEGIVCDGEKRLLEIRDKLLPTLSKSQLYDYLVILCSKSGLLRIMLQDILPLLEKRGNSLLESAESQYRIKLGIEKEELLVSVLVRDEWTSYELCSGGERFCVDLVIRVAMFLVFSDILKCDFQFLFIDEGVGSLDEKNSNFFVKFMKSLSAMIKQVYIVTHSSDIKSEFDVVYQVEKGVIRKE